MERVLLRDAVWEQLFSSSTEAFFNSRSVTARPLVRAVLKKKNNGSVAACKPMAMQPAKIGGASGYIGGRISDFFEGSN